MNFGKAVVPLKHYLGATAMTDKIEMVSSIVGEAVMLNCSYFHVFVEFSGHTEGVMVYYHPLGWREGQDPTYLTPVGGIYLDEEGVSDVALKIIRDMRTAYENCAKDFGELEEYKRLKEKFENEP